MLFHIAHDIFELVSLAANYYMDVTCHNAPTIYFKSLMLLAIFSAINHNLLILVTNKQVNPINHSKTYKI
jgi:hypothetical protein